MSQRTFRRRSLPSLADAIHRADITSRGVYAVVVESRRHMVRTREPGEGGAESYRWHPSSVRNLKPGTPGFLMPTRGTRMLFIPSGPDMWTTDVATQFLWTPGRWVSTSWSVGMRDEPYAVTITANRTYGVSFPCPQDIDVSQLAITITTAVAGSTIRLGIYESNQPGLATGSPVAETPPLSSATTGVRSSDVIESTTLRAGHLYVVSCVSTHAIGIQAFRPAGTHVPSTNFSPTPVLATYGDGSGGSWTAPVAGAIDLHPIIGIRRAT